MIFKILPILFFSLSFLTSATAQEKRTISGVIKDGSTGETLIGANVLIGDGSIGTVSNEYGFYSITIPQDTVVVTFSYIGFQLSIHKFLLKRDTTINLELSTGEVLDEVVVSASSNVERVNSSQMGVEEVTVQEAKDIAAIFGEVDIIKVLQLKPGVQSGTEGSSGLYVRGGGPDQNHFILDEASVYNPSHLFGFFSTFNADAVKGVKLYKAGFPSQYGGKLSSVIDIRMREGDRKKYHVTGGLGVIASRLTIEGPLVKDKGSFIVSARRTYVDAITAALNESYKNDKNWVKIPDYSFYDVNVKLNYDVSSKDQLFLSGYFGRDIFLYKTDGLGFNFEWGNIAGTLRWSHTISPKMFVNTAFTFSDYEYKIGAKFDDFNIELGSGIRDANLKTDITWQPSPNHDIRFGGSAIYHFFSVGRFQAGNSNDVGFEAGSTFHSGEFGVYFSDDWTISPKVKLHTGLRFSGFYNANTFYWAPEPRIALKYSVHKNVSIKANYSRMSQYIHLVSTTGATLPTDVWYPSNANVKPQFSDLVSLGVSWALGKDFYFSVEGYYKWMHNQVDFKDGARLFLNDELDKEFIFGKGDSYGAEFYIEKKNGDIRGWIGYTLSWTWRQFDLANSGNPYHPKNDRRHDISIVIMWDIPWTKPKFPLTLSASWVFGTGSAVSMPTGRYLQQDYVGTNSFQFVPIYTERGGFRMPDYHRLDIGIVWHLFPLSKKRFKSDITISVYNAYNRRNPFFMYIDAVYPGGGSGNNTNQVPERFEAKVVSLFPVLPSITWNFRW